MKDFVQRIAAPLFGISLLVGVHQADAAQTKTVSYTTSLSSQKTDINTTIELQKFDLSLGTLQSVTLSLASGVNTTITVLNNASTASYGTVYTTVTWTLSDPNSLFTPRGLTIDTPNLDANDDGKLDGLSYSLEAGKQVVVPTANASASRTYSEFTSGLILSEFSTAGVGYVSLNLSSVTETTVRNTGGNTSAVQETYADAGVTVTYTYIEAPQNIPEPSTWAMIVGGFGVLAFGQRLRRHAA